MATSITVRKAQKVSFPVVTVCPTLLDFENERMTPTVAIPGAMPTFNATQNMLLAAYFRLAYARE